MNNMHKWVRLGHVHMRSISKSPKDLLVSDSSNIWICENCGHDAYSLLIPDPDRPVAVNYKISLSCEEFIAYKVLKE